MRKLNTQDIFNFTKVMKAANLKGELQPLFLKGNNIKKILKNSVNIEGHEVINDIEPGKGECIGTFETDDDNRDIESSLRLLGIEVILTIIDACGNAGVEDKFYKFLAGPFEIEEKEVPKLSIEALFLKIEQLAKENNLIYFFKQAANLTK